jgi:predicted RNase H-like HicB family nuclease
LTFNVVVHEAEEGGYWAELPEIPGCAPQGETLNEVLDNIREAAKGCLSSEGEDGIGGVSIE